MLQVKLATYEATLPDSINKNQDPEVINLTSEIESEKEYLGTYKTLKSSWNIALSDGTVLLIPGKWSLLVGLLQRYRGEDTEQVGLADKIEHSERANARYTKTLYTAYGDFIYETTYENADELDSIGLYNQT